LSSGSEKSKNELIYQHLVKHIMCPVAFYRSTISQSNGKSLETHDMSWRWQHYTKIRKYSRGFSKPLQIRGDFDSY